MKKKQFKKKSSFGLQSKLSMMGKKNCPLAKKSNEEINYKNINIDTLDPYLKNNYLKQSIKQHYNNFNQIKKKYDLIIIANNNKYWKTIKFKNFNKRIVTKGLLYDYWNTFENIKKKNYIVYGSGNLIKKL